MKALFSLLLQVLFSVLSFIYAQTVFFFLGKTTTLLDLLLGSTVCS